MVTMEIELPPDLEAIVREQAQQVGMEPGEYARSLFFAFMHLLVDLNRSEKSGSQYFHTLLRMNDSELFEKLRQLYPTWPEQPMSDLLARLLYYLFSESVREKLVHSHEPVVPASHESHTEKLLSAWEAEDAKLTPEELAAEEADWKQFQANINAYRAEQGEEPVY